MARRAWFERASTYGNAGVSALGGAATGAALGTAIMPGIGTIIGGVGGALLGGAASLFGAAEGDEAAAEADAAAAEGRAARASAAGARNARYQGAISAADADLAALDRGENAAFKQEQAALGEMRGQDIDQFKTAFALKRAREAADLQSQYGGANAAATGGFSADMAARAIEGESGIAQSYRERELTAQQRIRGEILERRRQASAQLHGVDIATMGGEQAQEELDFRRSEGVANRQVAEGVGQGQLAGTLISTFGPEVIKGLKTTQSVGGGATSTEATAPVRAALNPPPLAANPPPDPLVRGLGMGTTPVGDLGYGGGFAARGGYSVQSLPSASPAPVPKQAPAVAAKPVYGPPAPGAGPVVANVGRRPPAAGGGGLVTAQPAARPTARAKAKPAAKRVVPGGMVAR